MTIDYPHHALVLRPRRQLGGISRRPAATGTRDDRSVLAGRRPFRHRAGGKSTTRRRAIPLRHRARRRGVMPSTQLLDAAKIELDRRRRAPALAAAATSRQFHSSRSAYVGLGGAADVPGIYTPKARRSPCFRSPCGALSPTLPAQLRLYTVDFDAMKIVLARQAEAPAGTGHAAADLRRRVRAACNRIRRRPTRSSPSTWNITARPNGILHRGEILGGGAIVTRCAYADGMENVSDPIPSGKLPPGPDRTGVLRAVRVDDSLVGSRRARRRMAAR